jgi:hypothetical protein
VALPAPEKKRFLKEVAQLVAKRPDKEKIKSILFGVGRSPDKSYVPELRQILARMKVEDEDDKDALAQFTGALDVAEGKKPPPEATPPAP